jgi:hypothetical protein
MTVDSSGLLYVMAGVSNYYTNISVYSSTATGAATPIRNIGGSNTGFNQSNSEETVYFAVDHSGNIYVSNSLTFGGEINVFSSTTTGNVGPTSTLNTGATCPEGIAVDSSGNIYAVEVTTNPSTFAQSTAIVEYASGATGAATPTKTIAGSSTEMSYGEGLVIDSSDTLYMVNQTLITGSSPQAYTYSVLEFGSNASGNVAPTTAFTSSSWTNGANYLAVH